MRKTAHVCAVSFPPFPAIGCTMPGDRLVCTGTDQTSSLCAGTAYVLSREAASRLLALFPFYPNPGREDAFFTGILGRGAGLQHFSPAHRAFFAASDTPVSAWCKFLTDGLVTGTGLSTGNHHHVVWSGVISNDWQCHTHGMADLTRTCWEEFANS